MKPINLFCLPFAGGNKYSYKHLEELSGTALNVVTMEYPGRGIRINEALLTNTNDLVDDVYNQLNKENGSNRFALYGHSMGGLIACLLTRRLAENNRPLPVHVFISGTAGPAATSRGQNKKHLLSDKDFISEIKALKGSPDELLNNEDLLDYFLPILRADFELSENYLHTIHQPLKVPFTVITGTEENITTDDIQLWQKETIEPIDFKKMTGDHFFIFNHGAPIIDVFSKKLFP